MSSALAALRKSSSMSALLGQVEKLSTKENYNDDRYWSLTRDKAGNGSALIRFLSAPQKEDLAFIRIFSHGFKGPTGKWYIENSLTTLGEQDFVAEENSALWATGTKEAKDIVSGTPQNPGRKRKVNYVSNILVINDPANPDNNGKVFLFKYGTKIFEMLTKAMKPPFPDMPSMNPFNFWDGANFRLRIRNADGYPSYIDSAFDAPSILGSDEEIQAIWDKEHSLAELLDRKHFKSYDELKKIYLTVLNSTAKALPPAAEQQASTPAYVPEEEDVPLFSQVANDPVLSAATIDTSVYEDEDDDVAYFKSLAGS